VSKACRLLLVVLLSPAVAAGQTTAPAPQPDESRPSLAELAEKIAALSQQTPSANIKAPPPTPAQQSKAALGCRLYRQAYLRLGELDEQAKENLSLLGLRAGFAAGDPEVMLSAAKLRWRTEAAGQRSDYAGYAMAWAGIFAGDAAAAKQGLHHLRDNSPQKSLAKWAKGMLPIAGQCDKPAGFSLRLLDGGQVKLGAGGKVTVVHFWASGSSASAGVMSTLEKFYQQRRKDRNFQLVGVSIDRDVDAARRTIRQWGLSWPQAVNRGLRQKFFGRGVPHVVAISPTGHILWQGHPALKDTLIFVTDFARRQAGRMPRPEATTTSPRTIARPKPPKTPQKPSPPTATPTEEAEADRLYKMAKTYMKLRMRAKAGELLREIVRKYPNTRAAKDAREELRY